MANTRSGHSQSRSDFGWCSKQSENKIEEKGRWFGAGFFGGEGEGGYLDMLSSKLIIRVVFSETI